MSGEFIIMKKYKPSNYNTKRMYGLDLLRICAMAVIFIGHSAMQIGCNYYCFAPLIYLRDIMMTLFFMLSGYVLYTNYRAINFFSFDNIREFWIKRGAAILPTYWLVSAGFIIFVGTDSIKTIVKLFPIEVLGLQTTLTTLFSISHNGGTWFVSCLLLSYFFYPYLQELIKGLSYRLKCSLTVLIAIVLTYIPFLVAWFGLVDIYDNPFYRGAEFIWGSCLAAICLSKNEKKATGKGGVLVLLSIVLILVLLYNNCTINIGAYRLGLYEIFRYILLGVMVVGAAEMNMGVLARVSILRCLISYLSGIAYEFFLAQFFTWKTSVLVFDLFSINRNILHIVISFIICLIYATMIHYLFTKPVVTLIKRKFLSGK